MIRIIFPALACTLVACAGLTLADSPVAVRDTTLGPVLTDSDGMTLYLFTRDEPGVSNCYDGCAAAWPPYMAEEGAAATDRLSLVPRDDGGQQWAYDDMPLYYWVNDQQPGDVTGQGVNDVWFVIEVSEGEAVRSRSERSRSSGY
ncbi:hypothetical protein E4656_09700 [Natronospirillum operosum]|uniref:Lipoprotein with Yx(FWY)xxD motif n=1 Tax=Natronospirillum operosum TaxID=2759953 RepID=A0A4Z0W8M4_9GAMM|nr:hypothetical protein [Natronospirillum operosum]TGG93319.1 hypothetical protein E4656_09700 [Natronospirillum operosum]